MHFPFLVFIFQIIITKSKKALPSIKPIILDYLIENLKVVFELYFSPGFRTTDGKSN